MKENGKKNNFNLKKFKTTKNLVLTITLVSFFGAIAYMQIGGSQNTHFGVTGPPIETAEDLEQDTTDQTHTWYPTSFPSFIPTSWPTFISIDTSSITTTTPTTSSGDIWTDTYTTETDTTSYGENRAGNITIGERRDKARNLPTVEFVDLGLFNFNLHKIVNMKIIGINSILFLSLLALPIIVLNKIIPNWTNRLHEFDDEDDYSDPFFVIPSRNLAMLKRKKDRVRRLLIFKDHVGKVIERSKIRIERKTPSHTIILGYYELDNAFSKFTSLKRTKDVTPLEHAHKHFETGEINNDALEKIVELFYRTRFGTLEIIKQEGQDFINCLEKLVMDKTRISEILKVIEEEINSHP
ncbi:MAG: hypothetical protein ACW99A_13140 [Candidatus Kariarchaeaceae archaeon]|jgi:hypothetical protein